MKILGIETSCDETSIAIVSASGTLTKPRFKVHSHLTLSQIKIHEKYGGVFPNLAQREHQKNLVPILKAALEESGDLKPAKKTLKPAVIRKIMKILERESELLEHFLHFVPAIAAPNIDAIAVTYGPGLEPTLWVGVNFAKALGEIWNVPVIPINHMEGHIVSVLLPEKGKLPPVKFPALALLISGGHTELVVVNKWGSYKRIGETRDDAVGEAFDKVARMLELPYPGGPHISRLAEAHRNQFPDFSKRHYPLPRPMIHSKDFDFSFSGLKTAVLYTLKKIPDVTEEIRNEIAREFEDSVVEVLVAKTRRAIEEYEPKTLIVGGGVIANTALRREFLKLTRRYKGMSFLIPQMPLTTDNALMIGIAGYLKTLNDKKVLTKKVTIKAFGNLRL